MQYFHIFSPVVQTSFGGIHVKDVFVLDVFVLDIFF